jgi:large subunit ribosomal protein L5
MARLKEVYKKRVGSLSSKEELVWTNVMEVPRITKITLNMGCWARLSVIRRPLENAVADLDVDLWAQKPVINNARKSIAGFKVRQGWPIGQKVTLRQTECMNSSERLVGIAIPRIRDFRGISPKQFDGVVISLWV